MILIIGSVADPHITSVTASLSRNGVDFGVLDSFSAASNGIKSLIADDACLILEGIDCSLERVSAIWWRQKPRTVIPANKAAELYDYYFVSREWTHIQEYLALVHSKCYCINPRESGQQASNKLWQLKQAKTAGFSIPRTLVSNSETEIRSFIKGSNQKIIFKTLTAYMNPSGLVTYTTFVDEDSLNGNSESIHTCPGIYQEFVNKAFELRITVVEDDVYVAKINSQASKAVELDWRQCIFDDLYTRHEVSSLFKEKLRNLHKRLGLVYGAYDFIVKEDGTPVFLEVNPMGQWMWLENQLGFPIGDRIAKALLKPSPLFAAQPIVPADAAR